MKCIKCGMKLDQYHTNQPYRGVHIRTYGHYGSTIIDSYDHTEWIDFYICDVCLELAIIEKVAKREQK